MKPVPRKPFADVVTTQIRAAILDGSLAPGSRIRQEELASRLGVSRAPVREALVVLEREGFVQTERWRGAVVASLDAQLISNIYDFRSAIDAYVAATLAARPNFDPGPFRKIVAVGRAAVSTPVDLRRLIDLDSQFHMGLYEAVGNRVLVDVMRAQWSHLRRAMAATLSISGYPQQVWDEHAAILDAIARRQASRASRLAQAHTIAARTKLLASLAPQRSSSERPIRARAHRRAKKRGRASLHPDPSSPDGARLAASMFQH